MSEPISAISPSMQPNIGAAQWAAERNDTAQFEQALQRNEQAAAAQYARPDAAPDAGLPQELLAYVGDFDARFQSTLGQSITDITALDFSDPMSIVHVMQLQADMFAVTMELELATKLADSGRHFTTTLFNNQG